MERPYVSSVSLYHRINCVSSSFLIRVAVFLPGLGKDQRCARSALLFPPAQHRLWAVLSCSKARHPEDIALDQSCVCLQGPKTIQRTMINMYIIHWQAQACRAHMQSMSQLPANAPEENAAMLATNQYGR